jgi:ferredoxin
MAVRITDECTACGTCLDTCPTASIEEGEEYKVNDTCTECLACVESCPTGAIVQT